MIKEQQVEGEAFVGYRFSFEIYCKMNSSAPECKILVAFNMLCWCVYIQSLQRYKHLKSCGEFLPHIYCCSDNCASNGKEQLNSQEAEAIPLQGKVAVVGAVYMRKGSYGIQLH